MANILIVEDDHESLRIASNRLREAGHKVITADNLGRALETTSTLKSFKVTIAILDGNLKAEAKNGNDGKMIANACRRDCPGIKIICWSRQEYDWGDVYCPKGPGYNQLIQTVNDLIENKPARLEV